MQLRRLFLVAASLAAVVALAFTFALTQGAGATPNPAAASVSFVHSCGPVATGFARCHAILRVDGKPVRNPTPTPTSGGGGGSCATNPTTGYTPCDLQSAY